jgi:predicted deacetylase
VAARLIVSMTADDSADVLSFADSVAERGVPLSLLVRPVGSDGPLAPTSRLVGWLRERQAGGDALVLHGYDHSRRPRGPQRRILCVDHDGGPRGLTAHAMRGCRTSGMALAPRTAGATVRQGV